MAAAADDDDDDEGRPRAAEVPAGDETSAAVNDDGCAVQLRTSVPRSYIHDASTHAHALNVEEHPVSVKLKSPDFKVKEQSKFN